MRRTIDIIRIPLALLIVGIGITLARDVNAQRGTPQPGASATATPQRGTPQPTPEGYMPRGFRPAKGAAPGMKVTDLGKSLGAALSLARVKAQAEGDKDLAQLLDFANVQPDGSSFKLEMAVPLAVLKDRLAFCREERQAAEAAKTAP